MNAQEYLEQKIKEGVIPHYNKKHIAKIMEEYAFYVLINSCKENTVNDKIEDD